MKKFSPFGIAALLALWATSAQASLIITPATLPQWTGNQTSQAQINVAIAPIIGSAVELYKRNVGQVDSGVLVNSYSTVFSNSATDPSDATITYDGGNIVGPTAWLLIKDGNHSPAWYLFNLTTLGWNGTETIQAQGFWPNGGAISHVTLYGTSRTPRDLVPEPGTLAIFGLGLACLVGATSRRRVR